MSQDNAPETPDTTPAAEAAPETPAAKRERASYPIRVMRRIEGGYGPPLEGFATIEQVQVPR